MKTLSGRVKSSFLALALVLGEWSVSRPSQFIPGERTSIPIVQEERTSIPIVQEAGCALEPVWVTWRRENS
jgi:hypothetical protein